jgi:hypothetical protein
MGTGGLGQPAAGGEAYRIDMMMGPSLHMGQNMDYSMHASATDRILCDGSSLQLVRTASCMHRDGAGKVWCLLSLAL